MDFEHQPANHLAFRLATTVLVPELLPLRVIRRQGAVQAKVVRYPGLKEELYFGDFEPEPSQARMTLAANRGCAAHSADPGRVSLLVEPAIRGGPPRALRQPGVVGVVLTRHPEQIVAIDVSVCATASCPAPRSTLDRSCTRPM